MKTISVKVAKAGAVYLSWKPRFHVSKLMHQCLLKLNSGLLMFHVLSLGILTSLLLVSGSVSAGGGAAGGGSTEITQILNNVQLANSYAQQLVSYQNQLMQYATMIQNLKNNPLGVLAPDLDKAVNDAARLWSVGKNIASSMS